MPPRICIVGAGVAGLRCSAVLLQNGFDVTIIEARSRPGGRIVQSDELGPLEVDISEHNPIIELARQTGTELHSWNQNTLIVDSGGELVSEYRANQVLQKVWQILEEALEHSKANSAAIDASESLYAFFVKRCQESMHDGTMKQDEVDLVLLMSQMWGAYVGARIEKQSLKYFFLEDCIQEDDFFIPSSYKKIVAEIARQPLKDARTVFDTRVTSVRANENGTGVEVRATAGQPETFDAVVMTTPLGWLKRNIAAMHPLSHRVKLAIESISFGNLEKVLIEFPAPFWERSTTSPTSFVHWLSPLYARDTNPDAWRLECVSFGSFAPPYRRNILLFYIYGDCAIHITRLIKGKAGDERASLLRTFFEPYYSRLPNWDDATCSPLKFLATEWANDEHSGFGSYCNFQVGIEQADDHVRALRHGMPEQGVYFAGEHTAPFNGLGTVSGAYASGQKVAERLVKKHSIRSQEK